MSTLVIVVIVAALIFDYINGFHDAANAIATSVSTGVLPLRSAVLLAALFNLVGAVVGTSVAQTIASGFAAPEAVPLASVGAAVFGASIWNLITWYYGIPSSSSHALIGGLAGAVVANGGLGAFHWGALLQKVIIPLVISPLIGFFLALFLLAGLLHIVAHWSPAAVTRRSRWLQLVSACSMAFSHGSNDAQKSMGIITLALVAFISQGALPQWVIDNQEWFLPRQSDAGPYEVPPWVIMACGLMIAAGTAAGGKRIIKTIGSKMVRITPLQGFAAETSGAVTILSASHLGIPISTTHCISACIMGVGAAKRLSSVRWGTVRSILVAWVLTLPASAGLGLISYHLIVFISDL